jgi:hypothetical protein
MVWSRMHTSFPFLKYGVNSYYETETQDVTNINTKDNVINTKRYVCERIYHVDAANI